MDSRLRRNNATKAPDTAFGGHGSTLSHERLPVSTRRSRGAPSFPSRRARRLAAKPRGRPPPAHKANRWGLSSPARLPHAPKPRAPACAASGCSGGLRRKPPYLLPSCAFRGLVAFGSVAPNRLMTSVWVTTSCALSKCCDAFFYLSPSARWNGDRASHFGQLIQCDLDKLSYFLVRRVEVTHTIPHSYKPSTVDRL